MDMTLIGQRIKQRREALNISAQELAEAIGINKATIHRYENGDFKSIKLPVIESIAKYLEVDPSWIIGKTDDPRPKVTPIPDRDKKDIAKILESAITLLRQDDITIDGDPAVDYTVESTIDQLSILIEVARKRNKKS